MTELARERESYPELLAASRRVDWRFLLDDPELGDVTCPADADPALIHACHLFSRSCRTFTSADELAPSSVDVLVLVDPHAEELRRAVHSVRPGGWAYVEVHGALTRQGRRGRAPRTPAGHVAELRRLGFEDVEPNWHWPTFATCTEIMPLADRSAVRSALVRRQAGRPWSPLPWAARLLLAGRVLPFVVTHTSVVGRSPAIDGRRR